MCSTPRSVVPVDLDADEIRRLIQQQLLSTTSFCLLSAQAKDAKGYTVKVFKEGAGFSVSIGGLTQHFECLEETVSVATLALSQGCRLRCDYIGSKAHAWTLERHDAARNEWVEQFSAGYVVWLRFGRPEWSVYMSNGPHTWLQQVAQVSDHEENATQPHKQYTSRPVDLSAINRFPIRPRPDPAPGAAVGGGV